MVEDLITTEQTGDNEKYNGIALLGIMDITQETYNTSSLASIVGISSRSVWTMCNNGLLKPIISRRIDSEIITRSHVQGGASRGRFFKKIEILKAAYVVGLVIDEYGKYHPKELRSYNAFITKFSPQFIEQIQLFYILLGLLHGSKAQLLTERIQEYIGDKKIKTIFENALVRMQSIE